MGKRTEGTPCAAGRMNAQKLETVKKETQSVGAQREPKRYQKNEKEMQRTLVVEHAKTFSLSLPFFHKIQLDMCYSHQALGVESLRIKEMTCYGH